MSAAHQVEVTIMSQSYLLACPPGGEDALRAVVARVDRAMCRIRDAGKVKARDRIAVLAALNLAFEEEARAEAQRSELEAMFSVAASAAPENLSMPAAATPLDAALEQQLRALATRIDAVLEHDNRLI